MASEKQLEAGGATNERNRTRRNRLDGPRDMVSMQSFEIRNLKRLNRGIDSPLVQLLGGPASKPYDETVSGGSRTYAELATRRGLQRVSRYADGVGPSKGYTGVEARSGF